MLIAQFTDMHVKPKGILTFGYVDTAGHLAACVAHVNALNPRPDAVLITGDLTNDGRPEEYATLRELLEPLAMPFYLIPGNHDQRENLWAAFSDLDYLSAACEFMHYVIDAHAVRLIGLDTTMPGKSGGVMCAARLAWFMPRAEPVGSAGTAYRRHPTYLVAVIDRRVDALYLVTDWVLGRSAGYGHSAARLNRMASKGGAQTASESLSATSSRQRPSARVNTSKVLASGSMSQAWATPRAA